jgi:hypothetical protein
MAEAGELALDALKSPAGVLGWVVGGAGTSSLWRSARIYTLCCALEHRIAQLRR